MATTLPHERKYVLSPENVQVARDIVRAISAKDYDKMDELGKKLIIPLSLLKCYGKEFVLATGVPTITAEIANDTDWLK